MPPIDLRALPGPNRWARVPVLEFSGSPQIAQRALELQKSAGAHVSFSASGQYLSAVEYEHEELARLAVQAAAGERTLDELRSFAADVLMGPNTRALFNAARRRGIPVRRLDDGTLLQLGHGVKQRRLSGAFTDRTSSIGENIGWEKPLAKRLLRAVGIPVPEGRRAADADDAWRAAQELGGTVVVKPEAANHGRSVFIGLRTREEIASAFASAATAAENPSVLVERMITGSEHRLLVVAGELAAATRGDPLYVNACGHRTIRNLIDEVNLDPRRGDAPECPLYPVDPQDEMLLATLARQGFTLDSTPPEGTRVLLQRNGNLSVDVTAQVHPANRALAVLAARTVGLDVAGIDLVVDDISRPIPEQGGAVLEVNAMPGIQMHLQPGSGEPRPVDDIIVASLFPPGETGRIPIIAALGGASGCRALAARLPAYTAVVSREGTWIGGEPSTATDVLLHPLVEAAVFDVTDADWLPFDYCDVLVADAAPQPWLSASLLPGGATIESIAACLRR